MNNSEPILIERLNKLTEQRIEDTDYSIEDICRELGVSRSHLFRVIKEQTGLSISRYIRQYRLLKGKELLETTDLKIAEITYKVGLDSPQTFTRFFTEDFGITPTEYRKNISFSDEDEDTVELKTEADEPISLPNRLVPTRARNYTYFLLIMIPLLLGGVWFWLKARPAIAESGETGSGFTGSSIAILPFKNSGLPETSLLADGVMEQVYSLLAQLENLKVISRNSSSLFKNTDKTIPQIATVLGVTYVLAGEVKQFGNRIIVSVELVKASDDRVVWAKKYDGQAGALDAFMNMAAREITVELDQKLSVSQSQKMDRRLTRNQEAYQEYLQGKQLMYSRNKEKLEASIKRFDRAIALDPSFADAYAYKASAWFLMGSSEFTNLGESIKLSELNALAAIRLDGENGLAYAILANIYRQINRWEQAVASYQIALKHSPNDAQINYWYSITLRSLGLFDEAITYSTKAMALDPLYPTIIVGHIGNYSYAGKFAQARAIIDNYELTLRDHYMFYYGKAFYHINQSDYKTALGELMKGDSINPNVKSLGYFVSFCRAKLGQKDWVNAYLNTLPPTPGNYPALAIVYAGVGDKENCLKYLQLGAELGILPEYLKVSPVFRFLRNDKDYQAILQRLGLNSVRSQQVN